MQLESTLSILKRLPSVGPIFGQQILDYLLEAHTIGTWCYWRAARDIPFTAF
jgi:hypothetical protein